MVETLPFEIEKSSDTLFLHFDVEHHHLSLTTFIQTAASARRIVEALDTTMFSGSGGFEVIVLPSRPGTFLQRLGVHPKKKLTVIAVGTFLCTPQGEAFTKGLTGQTTSEWFEDAGILLRDGLERLAGASPDGADEAGLPKAVTSDDAEVLCRTAVQIVTQMTRGILELSTETLSKVGIDTDALPEALDARAEFYEACLSNPDIKHIGFTPESEFPVPRSSFPERAQKPVRRKKDEEPEWEVAEDLIRVDSPTWDQEKQKSRQWLGVDRKNRNRYFVIEDAEFWERIRKKELHFDGSDQLAVQWAFQVVGGKVKNRRVLRVLAFNGAELARPLQHDAISAILGRYSSGDVSRNSPSLFDFMDD